MIVLKNVVSLCLILPVCWGESIRSQKCKSYYQKLQTNMLMPMTSPSGSHLDLAKEFPHIVNIGYIFSNSKFQWFSQGSLTQDAAGPIVRGVESVVRHPNYKSGTLYNDIGLIKMSEKVVFTEYIRPICLPETDVNSSQYYRINYRYDGGNGVRGTLNLLLSKQPIQLIGNVECSRICRVDDKKISDGLIQSQLCGQELVESDTDLNEGSPLQIDHPTVRGAFIQVGITSFRVRCGDTTPEIFTKVFRYGEWIESVVWAPENEE